MSHKGQHPRKDAGTQANATPQRWHNGHRLTAGQDTGRHPQDASRAPQATDAGRATATEISPQDAHSNNGTQTPAPQPIPDPHRIPDTGGNVNPIRPTPQPIPDTNKNYKLKYKMAKNSIRQYWYACNGYAIRHTSFDDRYFIIHPVEDTIFGIKHTLKDARKFAKSLPPLYPT